MTYLVVCWSFYCRFAPGNARFAERIVSAHADKELNDLLDFSAVSLSFLWSLVLWWPVPVPMVTGTVAMGDFVRYLSVFVSQFLFACFTLYNFGCIFIFSFISFFCLHILIWPRCKSTWYFVSSFNSVYCFHYYFMLFAWHLMLSSFAHVLVISFLLGAFIFSGKISPLTLHVLNLLLPLPSPPPSVHVYMFTSYTNCICLFFWSLIRFWILLKQKCWYFSTSCNDWTVLCASSGLW